MAHGRRYGMLGALIVIDLDEFQKINDRHGVRAGATACSCASRRRSPTACARPTCSPASAATSSRCCCRAQAAEAERVCQALEEAVPAEVRMGGDRRIEASVGFAPFTETMTSVEEAMLAADAAMYAVKAGTRATSGACGRSTESASSRPADRCRPRAQRRPIH